MILNPKGDSMRAGKAWWWAWLVLACSLFAGRVAVATTANGNEFCLFLTEAKTEPARKEIMDAAVGKQHFFRYLRITDIQEGEENGYPNMTLITCEPSSKMMVKFIVRKTASLIVLKQDPPSKVGDAVAVTGVVRTAEKKSNTVFINPVIVRYKDRLSYKPGREMLEEVDKSAIVYSFTGGKEPVNVTARDRDLLAQEGRITAEKGKDGWAKYLTAEIAKRDKAAAEVLNKLGVYRKEPGQEESKDEESETKDDDSGGTTNAPPSVLTEDDDE